MKHEVAHINQELQINGKMQPIHLGDAIICINLLYNRALNTNVPIKIYGPKWIKNLFELFDYGDLEYVGTYAQFEPMNISILDLFPRINSGALKDNLASHEFLKLNCFCKISNPTIVPYDKIILPKCRIKKQLYNNIYFQLDSRSTNAKDKTPLSTKQSEQFLDYFKSNCSLIGLGGIDTIPYLNYEFVLGDLSKIIHALSKSKMFLGVDSGISVLAGMIEIESKIICLSNTEPRASETIQMYNLFFPNTIVYRKDEFFRKMYDFPIL